MKMKNFLAMLLAAAMMLGTVSCSDDDGDEGSSEKNNSAVSSADDSADGSSEEFSKGKDSKSDSSEGGDSKIDLNDLHMQKELVGKWECKSFIYMDKEYTKDDLGVELYKQRFEFFDDNTGNSINPDGKVFEMLWSMENGSGFVVEKNTSEKADLTLEEGELTCEANGQTFVFKKVDKFTEDDSSSNSAADKFTDSLKSSNSNAKLVFTTVNGTCSDLIADGMSNEVKAGKVGPIKASELDESDAVQKEVLKAMKENNSEDGYVCWLVENTDSYPRISWAQWSEEKSGTVGQYPDPEKNAAAAHEIGEKF